MSSKDGIITLYKLKKQLCIPRTSVRLTEKLNSRSWSLTTQDERNMIMRIMAAQRTLNGFSLLSSKIQKIYYFSRSYAKPIFKKRQNNYLSFELGVDLPLVRWFSLLGLLQEMGKVIRINYGLPVGVLVKKYTSAIRFVAINPAISLAFLENEILQTKPQILIGSIWIRRGSIFNTKWLWRKLNEKT